MPLTDTLGFLAIILCITSASIYGFIDHAEKPEIESVEQKSAYESVSPEETINYSELSESQQEAFRERISTGAWVEVDTPPGIEQIQLDGRYYDTRNYYGDSRGYGAILEPLLFVIVTMMITVLAGIIAAISNESRYQHALIFVVTAVCLFSILYAQAAYPAQAAFMVDEPAVSSVPSDAVVVNASTFSNADYEAFLKSTTDGSAFLPNMDPDVEYVRSDGEYYPVDRTEPRVTMENIEWVFGGGWIVLQLLMVFGAGLEELDNTR